MNIRQIIQDFINKDFQYKLISNTKHQVYEINGNSKKYILKVFNNDDKVLENTELIIYKEFTDCEYIKKCLKINDEKNSSYIITEFVEGESLLESIEKETLTEMELDQIACTMYKYIKYCETRNCDSLIYPENWFEKLKQIIQTNLSYNNNLSEHKNKDALINIGEFLLQWIEDNREYFEAVQKVLIPVDLNLNNMILTEDGNLKVIDLDAFLMGDRNLALGEFTAHIYGTQFYEYFFKQLSRHDLKNIRWIYFYAMLSSYSILSFSSALNLNELDKLKPWGNRHTFCNLINSYRNMLTNVSIHYYLKGDLAASFKNNQIKLDIESGRVIGITDSLKRLTGLKKMAGITRIPDIRELDVLNIPAYQCVRPMAEQGEGTFSIFSGKGNTEEECKVAAIAEGIERFCSEKINYNKDAVIVDSYKALKEIHDVVNPLDFNIPKDSCFDENEELEWVKAVDILSGEESFVFANAVFYPYSPYKGRMLTRYFTTGLAGGNTYEEAILHGIAEVIERDAAALNILLRCSPVVNLTGIKHKRLRYLIDQIEGSGLNLIVRYITAKDINVPVFSVIIDDMARKDTMYISGGYGAHPNKETALMTAINEAVLSRVSTISGAREDLEKFDGIKGKEDYDSYKEKYSYWFNTENKIDFDEITDFKSMYISEDIKYMMKCLKNAGFNRVFMVDLTNPDIEFPIIKILVPGVERYSWKRNYGRRAKLFYKQQKENR